MILFAPSPTGSGHNMRTLSIGQAIQRMDSNVSLSVALGSLQPVFTPLYEASGIDVIDIAGTLVDYSTKSNLTKRLDWKHYIGDYIANTFMSGERILFYLSLIEERKPDLVVSDYNMAACIAAIISDVPLVFVTERYDFTLCQLEDDELRRGGFDLNARELQRARAALHRQFEWIIQAANVTLTDKPYVPSIDAGTPIEAAMLTGKAHFVGPMIRERNTDNAATVLEELGLGNSPFVVASISGTTMFEESKIGIIRAYLETHEILRREEPDLKLVLLGRGDVAAGEGVISIPYLPGWMGLLTRSQLLLSAPGWISVTEVAALQVPTLFVLPSNSEYHEIEALRRLELLGFPTFLGKEASELAVAVQAELRKEKSEAYFLPHRSVASPDWKGADRAAAIILGLARQTRSKIDNNAELAHES